VFGIYLTDEVVEESDGFAVYGRIHIGDYYETFFASLDGWTPAEYCEHWRAALTRIVDGEAQSVLITSYQPAHILSVWWPLYRVSDVVFVRNELLIYEQLKEPFDVGAPWNLIRERRALTDEGLPISEWTTSVAEIKAALAAL
jgi:hypothetical protein